MALVPVVVGRLISAESVAYYSLAISLAVSLPLWRGILPAFLLPMGVICGSGIGPQLGAEG